MNNVEKMLETAAQSPEKMSEFVIALLQSNVYVIATEQEGQQGEKKTLNMVTVENQGGQKCVPFFTSIARLMFFAEKMANGEPPYVEIKCKEFMSAVMNTGCILNPNSQNSRLFSPQEIRAILGLQPAPNLTPVNALSPGEQVFIGKPKVYPQKLSDALTEFLEKRSDVNRAWIFQIAYRKTTPHTLLVLDFEGDKSVVFPEIGEFAKQFLEKEGELLDIMTSDDSFVQQFLPKGIPFFDKQAVDAEDTSEDNNE